MRKMKDSGVPWIGKIPEGWVRTKIKHVSKEIGSGATPTTNVTDYYDGTIWWIQSGDVYGKTNITHSAIRVTETALRNLSALHLFKSPFIVIAMYGASVGNTAISEIDACTNQACCSIKTDAETSLRFMYYWLFIAKDDFLTLAEGGTQPNISQEKIRNQYFAQPPIAEQQRIADFLDAKSAEIDTLQSQLERQIEVLETYKRSVITETVTRGLDPAVQMKDSGIPWISEIPAHWEVNTVSTLYRLRNTKVSDEEYTPLSVTMQGIVPQLETAAKTDDHANRKLVRMGDFVINSRSDRRGSCGISPLDGSVSLINTVLQPMETMDSKYYEWLFHTSLFSDEFYKWGHGIVDDLWTTGWADMKRIQIPVPPLTEQRQIAVYLDKKASVTDGIVSLKRDQLAKLADYKKSLIFEYVTGKKEVLA